jgi:hypothetical protein
MDEAVAYLERDLDKMCEVYWVGTSSIYTEEEYELVTYVTRGWCVRGTGGTGVNTPNPMFSIKNDHPLYLSTGDSYCPKCDDGRKWIGAPGQQREHVGGSHP